MASDGNSIIYYQAIDYSTAADKLMGRNAASELFLKNWIQHSPFDEVWAMVKSQAESKAFGDFFNKTPKHSKSKGRACLPLHHKSLKEIGCLYLPDPNIVKFAFQRDRVGRFHHSLVGVTHTLSSTQTLELISSYLTSPIYPWDGLICTSSVVKKTVDRLFQQTADYLAHRLKAKVRVACPKTPIIPLGVDLETEYYEKKDSLRDQWRKELGIEEDAIVFLFYGRLSFHAKANPFAMYRSLQIVAEQTGKKIVLIQAGWFANTHIEQVFKKTAVNWAPSIKSIFLDGRQVKVRNELRYACDIFISLSDNIQETFGLTPIEAMAAGLPSVVSDWNGYKDTVRHGVDGFRIPTTVPSEDEALLDFTVQYEAGVDTYDQYIGQVSHSTAVDIDKCIEACKALVESAELRKKFGEQARREAEATFSWEKIVGRYVEFFKELNEIRKGHAHHDVVEHIHPTRSMPFQNFLEYPTERLSEEVFYKLTHKDAKKQLMAIYENGMFNYAGLDPLEVAQKILNEFSIDKGNSIKLLPKNLAKPLQIQRVICFFLKVGLLKKL